MDREGFRRFLQERKGSEDQIMQSISIVLIKEGANTYDNFVALARYGLFAKNNDIYVSFFGLIDGGDVIDVLFEKLGDIAGEDKRDEVFNGIELPPLGLPPSQKPKVTQTVVDKLEALVDAETCKTILSEVAHGIPKEYHLEKRNEYLRAKNIDEYIKRRRAKAIAQLEKHRDEGTPFFNQEITDEVIDFVKSRPDILTGVRRGNKIYHTKIPYMPKEYLAETDEMMKRYYCCHCQWARESIKAGDVEVSPTFCYCSAGFTKQPWEVALDQPLEVEVVKSVLKGDLECSFVVHLPEGVE
ncbi:MAG: hypothetical protein ACTSPR_02025 [Candidatus Thorarchaeota archaeon]